VKAWRTAAFSAGAIAAALALALILRPEATQLPVPQVQTPSRPLVATLSTPEDASQLVATWDPATKRLFVSPDDDLRADSAHSHELWIIPSDGRPRSLGTLAAESQTVSIPEAVAAQFGTGATLAISVEPLGGSTTGLPTGPVIATGILQNL
jgi:anti-sigma-K factor RskA